MGIRGGEALLAAGNGPDMSPLDAGACPFLEREVEASGAETKEEIRAAVKEAWKKVTPTICKRIMLRVRRNMQKVVALNGGNFYTEK